MRSLRKSVPLIVALVLAGQAGAVRAEAYSPGVGGRVFGQASPLAAVRIWAYQLADLSRYRVMTDPQGNFLFKDLPAGLYQIVAHKTGFAPAMVMLPRATAQAYQTLELQLSQLKPGQGTLGDDFWAVRSRLPADVLREIEIADVQDLKAASFTGRTVDSIASEFQAEMQALTGVDQIAGGQLSGGGVGLKGQVGQTQVGLKGQFMQLSSTDLAQGTTFGTGQTSSLSIDLDRGPRSRINISSLNNRMIARDDSGDSPIGFQNYQVHWSQDVGENGHSDFAAHYTAENNFHSQTRIDPLDIPETSRSLGVEGAYTTSFGDSSTLQAGLRYRERQFGLGIPSRTGTVFAQDALSSIDLFSRGGVRVQPAVLMEYGLYSTLSDGTLALTPQGGFVLQLASNWQFETTAARRVYVDAQVGNPDFLPTLFAQRDLCEQGSEACYQMNLARKVGDDNTFTLGAVHRTVGDTLRLYFSEDFFDRLESLYLVRGDKLPEVHMGLRQKLSPKVITTLDSSMASGGGGTFFAANGQPYENQVRYLVTSLDTQFLGSSTGVFVSFHHLEQRLDPAALTGNGTFKAIKGLKAGAAEMEYERLQLMVTQNLNFLLNLASDWAVQLNMELSRGGMVTSTHDDTEVRRRILGGIAVKF